MLASFLMGTPQQSTSGLFSSAIFLKSGACLGPVTLGGGGGAVPLALPPLGAVAPVAGPLAGAALG